MRLKTPLTILSLLLAAAGLAACARGETAAQAESSSEPPPVNVAVLRVEPADLTERIELSGRLEPWVEVRVATELGGQVEHVGFQKGAYVKEGQVLARVGSDLHQANVAEAEAVLGAAEATYERTQQLFERQAVTRQSLINATSEFEAATARVAQSRVRLERSIIRAPASGIAIARDAEPGEVLPPGAAITTIHRLDRLKATVGVPEIDVGLVRVGGPALVRVDAWPDRSFEGRIHFLAPSTSGSSRTFPAEIAIDNRDGALRPGMVARVSLVRRTYQSAVVVPRDALQERDLGSVAVVLDGEVARVRHVTLGAVDEDRVVIDDGLAAGDWLIVSGHRGLIDGQRVQVVEGRE